MQLDALSPRPAVQPNVVAKPACRVQFVSIDEPKGGVFMSHVRGSLFVDYVRLIRSRKDVDWSRYLEPQDFVYLQEPIEDAKWYPTSTFERMGLGIVHGIAFGSLVPVHAWGRAQVDAMLRIHPEILEPDNPRESLMRVVVHRRGFFDFEVLVVREIADCHASFELQYQMSDVAELAASMQTMGAFEELVERAGGSDITARFTRRAWEGNASTVLELAWAGPSSTR
jgi:hypothetical protein